MKIKVAQPLTEQQIESLINLSLGKIESLIRTRIANGTLEEGFFEYMASLKSFFEDVLMMYQVGLKIEEDVEKSNQTVGETKKIINIKKWKK